MQSILITGGAGFIGSTLADSLLSENEKVIVLDDGDIENNPIKKRNIGENLTNPNYKLYQCNIQNKEELENVFQNEDIKAVVHLAAKASVRDSLGDPAAYFSNNIMGTVNILDVMTKYNVKKFVFASSATVYGGLKENVFREDMELPPKPSTPYAATKAAGEEICYTYHHIYGINAICLRLFTTYGPRQRQDLAINKFTELILEDKTLQMFGDGKTKRDYVYVDDVVEGMKAAIKYDKTGYEIINIGSGESINIKNLIATLELALGKRATVKVCPALTCDAESSACDYSKANKLLGYTPKTSFVQGIKQFVDWKQAQK